MRSPPGNASARRLTGRREKKTNALILRAQSRKVNEIFRVRGCVACGWRVTNRNLGGFDGRSALSGSLWCYDCADGRATP